MSLKVLIERHIKAGKEEAAWAMLRDLRSQAVRCHGYLYSETWQSVTQPRVVVTVSVWANQEAWERWKADEFRQKMDARLNELLTRPGVVRLFNETSGPPVVIRTS